MPGKSRKYTAAQDGDFKMRALEVLVNSEEALTIDDIKSKDIILSPLPSQKIARVLGFLIDMGMVKKSKSKPLGRMVYKSVAKMIEQGYEVEV